MPERLTNARPLRRLLVLGVISLCAVGAGAWACALNGISAAVWGRSLGAWLVGGLAAILVQRGGSRMLAALLPLAVILLGGAFLGPEQSGVHRWLGLGPLSINAAMLILPAAVIPLALFGGQSLWSWLVALTCMALLAAQPDRSQATAFGAAVIWIALRTIRRRTPQVAVITVTALMLAGAILRPDPLKPVPEVEGILQLAYVLSPALAAAGLIFLLAFSVLPAVMMRDAAPANRLMGEALSLYFLVAAVMPFVGAYPVPLVGVGVGPVLGSWLAIGAFSAACSIAEKADIAPDRTN